MPRKENAFSLIELLIALAIILIIAAIAIPNLVRSRMAANEASAVASIRSINSSEIVYSSAWGVGYATALSNLGGTANCLASSSTACLIDPVLAAGTKSGYTFAAIGNNGLNGQLNGYEVNGTPVVVGAPIANGSSSPGASTGISGTAGIVAGTPSTTGPAGLAGSPGSTGSATANPATSSAAGTRSCCSDESGVIRYNTVGIAIGTSPGSCAAVTTVFQ